MQHSLPAILPHGLTVGRCCEQDCNIEEAVVLGFSGLDICSFRVVRGCVRVDSLAVAAWRLADGSHTLEVLQCMVERRAGGESKTAMLPRCCHAFRLANLDSIITLGSGRQGRDVHGGRSGVGGRASGEILDGAGAAGGGDSGDQGRG